MSPLYPVSRSGHRLEFDTDVTKEFVLCHTCRTCANELEYGEEAHDDRVDPDERLREAGAGDRDERRVEAGRDRLGEHRLAGAGRAEEEQAALTLAARLLERLAALPEADDAAHLLLRLGLAAHVLELGEVAVDVDLGVACA